MKSLALAAMACALALAAPLSAPARTLLSPSVGQPATYENLTIFPVRGERVSDAAAPLALQEAMQKNLVRVRETGNVNALQIENLGDRDVFIQAGDIVKGGKQDRVLSVDLLLEPKSGPVSIASFCVEQGRWQKRGGEKVDSFASSTTSLPSREIKLAAAKPIAESAPRGSAQPQQEVWRGVQKMQDKLSGNLSVSVAAAASPSSLQLTMENEKLKSAIAGYEKALRSMVEVNPDATGIVIAINGRISSADLYSSPALLRAMWPKLLNAAAVEAVAEKKDAVLPAATIEQATTFLDQARVGQSNRKRITARISMETRENENSLTTETQLAEGGWVHRSYLAK